MAVFTNQATVEMLADVLTTAPNAKGQLYARKLEDGALAYDDFADFEGAEGSDSVFYAKRDWTKTGGDKMHFTVQSDLAGPGVRGEAELTGHTSTATYSTYSVTVDFWRDAHELSKKERKFLAAGEDLEDHCINKLKVKLGRQRANDMKMSLIRRGSGNTLRPNGRKTRDEITGTDTLTPSFLTTAKPQLQRIGGRPVKVGKNKEGSPVNRYIAYVVDSAMVDIRNDTTYQNALLHAMDRGMDNPMFSGKLLDWNGMGLFEHIAIDADWDDFIGEPCAPRAVLGSGCGFGVDTALGGGLYLKSSSSNTVNKYFQHFPGYDYIWVENQDAVTDSATYYAWIVNPDGSVGFVSYVGTDNSGNKIKLTHILSPAGAGTSTKGTATLGNLIATDDTWSDTPGPGGTGTSNTSADFNYTDTFVAGAYILPANANGAVIAHSFLFGKGAAIRGYGSSDTFITQERDYGFVKGAGYESVFGQSPIARTDGKTHGYAILQHAIQVPGLEVPRLYPLSARSAL